MQKNATRVIVSRVGDIARFGIVVFLLLPGVLVTVLSFSGEPSLRFPPRIWGLMQYRELFASDYWLDAIGMSFSIAIPTAILCLLIGVPATVALYRTNLPFRGLLNSVGLAPLLLPSVAYAVAMYTFFLQIGFVGHPLGLMFVHVVLGLPFVIIIVGAALNRLPRELELVAMTLGAPRWRATLGITVRLLVPALAATFIFTFIHSFDEATFVNFVGGPGTVTLPKAIFDSVRTGIDPLITAIATLLMVSTALVMLIATYWRTDRGR